MLKYIFQNIKKYKICNMVIYVIYTTTTQQINVTDTQAAMQLHFLFKDISVRRQMYSGFPLLGYNNFRY